MTAALLDFPRLCGPCSKGRCDLCVGLGCSCRRTERCKENARLSERERRP